MKTKYFMYRNIDSVKEKQNLFNTCASSTTVQKYNKPDKKFNVLIVDDDEDSRNALKNIISSRCNVATIDDGLKCINRCSEVVFDIIFLDFHINDCLGNLDGADVCKLIQECFDIKNTLIFAYTGDNSSSAVAKFQNTHMTGAFIKPISHKLINEFLSIIEHDASLHNDMTTGSPNERYKSNLKSLAVKNRNFIYFN